MRSQIIRYWLVGTVIFLLSPVEAAELYFVDAHSQFDNGVEAELILKRMDEAGVYKTILATRGQRKPRDAAELAEQYPQRIVASVRTKGAPYAQNSGQYYKQLDRQVTSGRFSAMAELLVFHAQKGNKAEQVRVTIDDRRVQQALKHAIARGWPFVVHIEFASLNGSERAAYLRNLKSLLSEHARHPFALIHMGQLPVEDVAALLKAHPNIYFLTSHADPVSAVDSTQPWINMMDNDKFKPSWKQLIQAYPEHFVFALDNVWDWQWQDTYLKHIKLWRSALADLTDETAHAVAHANAERLWRLQPKP